MEITVAAAWMRANRSPMVQHNRKKQRWKISECKECSLLFFEGMRSRCDVSLDFIIIKMRPPNSFKKNAHTTKKTKETNILEVGQRGGSGFLHSQPFFFFFAATQSCYYSGASQQTLWLFFLVNDQWGLLRWSYGLPYWGETSWQGCSPRFLS